MYDCTRNYINGEWVPSTSGNTHDIINPATEESIGKVAYGTAHDVDQAVTAARAAFGDAKPAAARSWGERSDSFAAQTKISESPPPAIAEARTLPARSALASAGSGGARPTARATSLSTSRRSERCPDLPWSPFVPVAIGCTASPPSPR